MATSRKAKTTKQKATPALPVIPPVQRPRFMSRDGVYATRWLSPNHKLHGPVQTWSKQDEQGDWIGWLESQRKTQILPTTWSHLVWTETEAPPVPTTTGAQPTGRAAMAVNAGLATVAKPPVKAEPRGKVATRVRKAR
jgi:hypothetical protein